MSKREIFYTNEPFETIEEFIDSLERGKEVGFIFANKEYFIDNLVSGYSIAEANKEETEIICKDMNELLMLKIENCELQDIITEMEITWRNL